MTETRLAEADAAADVEQRVAQELREGSRRLPTGVSVLTAVHGEMVHGATVSTVSVVSQHPLTVCASLRYGSQLARLATASGLFVVNVLSSAQAMLADWFANPQRPPGREQFGLVRWEPQDGTGIPLLNGCLAQLTCRLTTHQPVGQDDGLLLAEVVGGHTGTGRPLVNFDGGLYAAELHDVVRRQGWRPEDTTIALWD